MATAAYMQKLERAGSAELVEMAKATKSVRLVTVMDVAACARALRTVGQSSEIERRLLGWIDQNYGLGGSVTSYCVSGWARHGPYDQRRSR